MKAKNWIEILESSYFQRLWMFIREISINLNRNSNLPSDWSASFPDSPYEVFNRDFPYDGYGIVEVTFEFILLLSIRFVKCFCLASASRIGENVCSLRGSPRPVKTEVSDFVLLENPTALVPFLSNNSLPHPVSGASRNRSTRFSIVWNISLGMACRAKKFSPSK